MQVVKRYSDAELVSALKNPKEMDAAIRVIYKEYYGLLESFVVDNNGNKEDAADVIQEAIVAFIEAVKKDKFRGEASVKSFLYAITRNLWLIELRKRNSAENRNKIFEKAKDTIEQNAMQHLVQREHVTLVQQLLARLGAKCKKLLTLVYYEDLSMTNIIKQMPDYQNEQVLRNKKYKCMKQLEDMMLADDHLRTQFKNALKNAG